MSEKLSIPDDVIKKLEDCLGAEVIELIQDGDYEEITRRLWKIVGEAKKFFPKKEWYGGVSYSGALIWVGEDYAGTGDFKSAIGYFEKVVREDPNREKALKDLVMALICLGYEERNISHFKRALELELSKEAKHYISLVLICLGLEEGKAEYFEKALTLFDKLK